MEEPPAAPSLGDCDAALVRRIVELSDGEDLFFLRQVNRTFRDAADRAVRRVTPVPFSPTFAQRFPLATSLDVTAAGEVACKRHLSRTLGQLSGLRELMFSDHGILADDSDQWTEPLRGLTLLAALNSSPRGDALAIASRCTSLHTLQLVDCRLRWPELHAAVAALAGSLTQLDLDCVRFASDEEHAGLLGLNTGRLRTLRLRQQTLLQDDSGVLPGETYRQLAVFTSLRCLDLGANQFLRDFGIEQLNALKQLESLGLSHAGVSCAGLASLSLTRLTQLGMAGADAARPARRDHRLRAGQLRAVLAGFPRLARLDVSSGKDLNCIGALSPLSHLTLLRAGAGGPGAQLLRGLTQLRDLALPGAISHESQLRCLSDLCRLTRLDMAKFDELNPRPVALSAAGLRWLSSLSQLAVLSLMAARFCSDACGEQLAQLRALRALDLILVAFEFPGALQPLARLPLQWLRLPRERHQAGQAVPHGLPLGLAAAVLKGRRQAWSDRSTDEMCPWSSKRWA